MSVLPTLCFPSHEKFQVTPALKFSRNIFLIYIPTKKKKKQTWVIKMPLEKSYLIFIQINMAQKYLEDIIFLSLW